MRINIGWAFNRSLNIFLVLMLSFIFSSPAISKEAGFLDLKNFCLSRGFTYYWDPVAKNALIQSSVGELRFHSGSEYVLYENKLIRMPEKAKYADGVFMVPQFAQDYLTAAGISSAPPATVIEEFKPIFRIRKVIVDAGHGGKDPGAESSHGLKEKRLVLEIARKVKEELAARGIEVVMTRNSDVFIPLAGRADIANTSGADFFISIHANASTSRALNGFEVYHLSEATDDIALAAQRAENSVVHYESTFAANTDKNLKTILWDLRESQNRKESMKAAEDVAAAVSHSLDVGEKRIRGANFYVLKWTECPSILVELGYLTNREDELKLRNARHKSELARLIVEGFLEYKKEFERTNGFTS